MMAPAVSADWAPLLPLVQLCHQLTQRVTRVTPHRVRCAPVPAPVKLLLSAIEKSVNWVRLVGPLFRDCLDPASSRVRKRSPEEPCHSRNSRRIQRDMNPMTSVLASKRRSLLPNKTASSYRSTGCCRTQVSSDRPRHPCRCRRPDSVQEPYIGRWDSRACSRGSRSP